MGKSIDEKLGSIESDIKWIVKKLDDMDNKFAKKYIERIVWVVTATLLAGIVKIVLDIIPVAHAHINSLIT